MKTLATAFVFMLSLSVFAQDRIIKKSKEIIECTVTELAIDEVKYYYPDKSKLIFGIDNALVEKVEFSTGEVIEIEGNTFENQDYYANQNKHALKINFLSPLFGTTEFVFEKNIKPGKAWETALGIIGLGNDIADVKPRGLYGKFAYKFNRNPDFYMQRMHYSHILKGAYFAPEIALRYVKYDKDYYYSAGSYSPYGYGGYGYSTYGSGFYYDYPAEAQYVQQRESQVTLAFMLKLGKQWVFDDSFLIDIYWGIGYGIGTDNNEALPYGFIVAPDDFPIALTSGIRIGWVFGK